MNPVNENNNLTIPIGVRAAIELQGSGNYFTTIRGVHENKYLLIDMPVKDGKPLPLKSHVDCIFRFVHQGAVIGFVTSVLESIYRPVPVVFVRYPQQIERKVLRSEERYRTLIDASLTWEQRSFQGTITDLSKRGCQLQTTETLEKGAILHLTFSLPNQASVERLKAEVRNVTPQNDGFLLGLYFPEIDKNIEEFVMLLAY
jgi:c-di-GMP-binding flagellar brake protein YcgR